MLFYTIITLSFWGCKSTPEDSGTKQVPEEPSINELEPPHLRRLSSRQYENTINSILGSDIIASAGITATDEAGAPIDLLVIPNNLEPDVEVEGLISVGASITSVSPVGVERYESAAYTIAEQIRSILTNENEALLSAESEAYHLELLGCTAEEFSSSDQCAEAFVNDFGQQAWRRPLSTSEQDRILTVFSTVADDSGDYYTGLQYALAAILQSPYFIYRAEEVMPGTSTLTEYSLASKLSFLLWNNTPDAELLEAAEQGLLSDPQKLEEQVDRLIADEQIKEGIRNLFNEILGLYKLDSLTKDPLVFTHASSDLGPAAREETLRTLEWLILEEEGDFRDLLTTKTTFVDRRLAALYDIPAPSPNEFAQTVLDKAKGRHGLLGQASFLTSQAHATSTSATLRGVFIRTKLLCQIIPPPPANIDTSIPEADAESPTLRERIASHLEDPSCAGCHQLTDQVGLGLENFDGIGRWRSTENDVNIDASGSLDGVGFDNAWELGTAVRNHPSLPFCFAKHLHQYASGHHASDSESEYLDWLTEAFWAQDYSFLDLLRTVAVSEHFRSAGE